VINYETVDREGLRFFLQEVRRAVGERRVAFVCIGTDRSSGDSLGPLVGTGLQKAGFTRVIGTLETPCDANSMSGMLAELGAAEAYSDCKVIAVDAGLGRQESIGKYQVAFGPLLPGASLGRGLPEIGDYSIAGIVNASGVRKYAILQTTSLYRVMRMADEIVAEIAAAFK
jgi:putative sporulation protein YyaC